VTAQPPGSGQHPPLADRTPPEEFRDHLPAIVAAAVMTVAISFLGSLLGSAGTIGGLALGSLLSGTGSWYGERGIRLAAAKAKARREAARRKGAPLSPHETQVIGLRVERERRHLSRRLPLVLAAGIGAGALLAGGLVIMSTQAATGRTVSEVVQGRPAVPSRSQPRPPASLPAPASSPAASAPSAAAPSASARPDTSPSASQQPASSQPPASVTASGSATASPGASPSAAVTPAATATGGQP